MGYALAAVALLAAAAIGGAVSVRRVPPWGRLVVYRWGRTGPELVRAPGLRVVLPVMDRGVLVDLREKVVRLPRQTTVASDEQALGIDLAVGWRIVDPLQSQTRVDDFAGAVQEVAGTVMRTIVSEMTAAHVVGERVWLGERVREKLGETVRGWGGVVTVVSVTDVVRE